MFYLDNIPVAATIEDVVYDLKREAGVFSDVHDVGNDLIVTCPFHKNGMERNPSLGIAKNEVRKVDGRVLPAGTCGCFTCGYTADIVKLVSDVLGFQSRIFGERWIKKRYVTGAFGDRPLNLNFSRESKQITTQRFNPVLVTHYHSELLKSDRALSYLRSRKLDNTNVLNMFGVGYDPESDMIVFPVYDLDGQVRMLKKRSIEGKRFDNTKDAYKANLVFGLYQLKFFGDRSEPVWVCESEIDALTVWTYGAQAIAIMGSSVTDEQVREILKLWHRQFIDGMDRDQVGRNGWRKFKNKTWSLGIRAWDTKNFGCKKDINELSKSEFERIQLY